MVYVFIIFITLWYQTHLSKMAAKELARSNAEKDLANEQTKKLLDVIKVTAESLVTATQAMNNNLRNAREVSDNIDASSAKVSVDAKSELESIGRLRDLLSSGVEQVSNVKEASSCMTESSLSTQNVVPAEWVSVINSVSEKACLEPIYSWDISVAIEGFLEECAAGDDMNDALNKAHEAIVKIIKNEGLANKNPRG